MGDRIEINKIGTTTMLVPIVGTAPLIVHNFSEKSKRQMLEAQQGKKSPKLIRDPQAEYEAAFYRIAYTIGGTTPSFTFSASALTY